MTEDEIVNKAVSYIEQDLLDEEAIADMKASGIDQADIDDVIETMHDLEDAEVEADVNAADRLADENLDPLNIDSVDALADANTKKDDLPRDSENANATNRLAGWLSDLR